MVETIRPLVILAAMTAGLFVVADAQQRTAPPTVAVMTPAAKPSPPTRTKAHRQTHRPIPKSAKRKVWPKLPGVKPIPPIAREEKRKRKAKPKQQQRITAAQCAQLRDGIARVGTGVARIGARARGYTDAQFDWAVRQCRI